MLKNIVVAITANTAGLRQGLGRTAAEVQGVDKSLQATNATAGRLRTAILGITAVFGVALVAAIGASVSAASNFEAEMNRVGAIAQASGDELQRLDQQARDLGASTAFSASEAAEGMGFLAMAGFEVNEIMSAMPSTLDLAIVGQLELAQAADITSNVLQGFGLEAAETARVNDVLAETAVNANTSIEQLGDAMSYAAPIANAAGWELEQVASAIGLVSDAGIQGGRAGTTLVGIIAALEDQAGPAGEKLSEMGIRTHDAAGELMDLADIVEQVEERGMTAGEALDVFGRRAGPGFAVLVSTGSEALRDMETRLDGAAGAAERIATEQFQGLQAAMVTVRSATEGAAIAFGRFFLPHLTRVAEGMASGIQSLAQVLSGATEEAGRFAPIVENLVSIGRSLGDVLGQIVRAGAPVVTLLGAIAGAVILTGLATLVDVLETVARWVADSEVAVAGLATVLTYMLLPALTRAVTQMQVMAVMGLTRVVEGMAAGFAGLRGALRGMRGSAVAANVALGAIVAGAVLVYQGLRDARSEAREFARDLRESFGQDFDTDTMAGSVEAITAQMGGLRGELNDLQDEFPGFGRRLGGLLKQAVPGLESDSVRIAAQTEALADELDNLGAKSDNVAVIMSTAWAQINDAGIGVTQEGVLELADAMGIDLATAAQDEAIPALVEAAIAAHEGQDDHRELAHEVSELANEYIEAANALKEWVDENRAMVDPVFGAQRALEQQAEAQQALKEAREEGDTEAVADAERDLARAYADARWAVSELIDENGELVATKDDLREFFAGIDDERVLQRVLEDFDMTTDAAQELLEYAGIELDISADGTQARDEAETVGNNFAALRDDDYTATLDLDLTLAGWKQAEAEGRLDEWDEAYAEATADIDNTPTLFGFSLIEGRADDWGGRTDTSTADTDDAPARSGFDRLTEAGREWAGSVWRSRLELDTRIAETRLGRIIQRVSGLGTASGGGGGHHSIPEADGGVLDFFAGGSENHVAQIAPAGAWRVWAEPETGGEAYIPLAQQKRDRSEAILGDVARRFGYQLVEMRDGGSLVSGTAGAGRAYKSRGGDGAAAPLVGTYVINPGTTRRDHYEAHHRLRMLSKEVGR